VPETHYHHPDIEAINRPAFAVDAIRPPQLTRRIDDLREALSRESSRCCAGWWAAA
jgi:hypothetical protein